jgi:hypothetical protein
MSEQLAYTLAAACFGFISAIYLCIGTALLSQRKMVLLCGTYWGFNEEQARAIVSQSTQYAIGGLLLVVSFFLQVVATLASATNRITLYTVFTQPLIFVAFILVVLGILSFATYRIAISFRLPQAIAALRPPVA